MKGTEQTTSVRKVCHSIALTDDLVFCLLDKKVK